MNGIPLLSSEGSNWPRVSQRTKSKLYGQRMEFPSSLISQQNNDPAENNRQPRVDQRGGKKKKKSLELGALRWAGSQSALGLVWFGFDLTGFSVSTLVK